MKKYRLLKDTMYETLTRGLEFIVGETDQSIYDMKGNRYRDNFYNCLWHCANKPGIWAEEINDCHLCNGHGHIFAISKDNPASKEKKDCPECNGPKIVPGHTQTGRIDDINGAQIISRGEVFHPNKEELEKQYGKGILEKLAGIRPSYDIGHVEDFCVKIEAGAPKACDPCPACMPKCKNCNCG